MKVYADTSVLVAWFHPADHFAAPVRAWLGKRNADFIWNPILRVELRHTLRRLSGSYARVAWDATAPANPRNGWFSMFVALTTFSNGPTNSAPVFRRR
jgi:hypothetical protein